MPHQGRGILWRPWPDSNRRIAVLQTAVLTTSPHGHVQKAARSYQKTAPSQNGYFNFPVFTKNPKNIAAITPTAIAIPAMPYLHTQVVVPRSISAFFTSIGS